MVSCATKDDETKYIYGIKNEFRFENFIVDTANSIVSIDIYNPTNLDSGFGINMELSIKGHENLSLWNIARNLYLDNGRNKIRLPFSDFLRTVTISGDGEEWRQLYEHDVGLISVVLFNDVVAYRSHADSSAFEDGRIIHLFTVADRPNYDYYKFRDSLYTEFPIVSDSSKVVKIPGWMTKRW